MQKKLIKKIKRIAKTKKICTADICQESNFFHKLFCNHIHHIHKHGQRLIRLTHKHNHNLMHLWELLLMGWIFMVNSIWAWFTPNSWAVLITDHTIIASNLIKAENRWGPWLNDSKIISMWTINSSVENSFYPWYCTYWAALISPEFFPFVETNKQQRTWWWNAKDRCANAQATWYKIGTTPVQWALIVYSKIWNSTLFGHVGKVIYSNSSKGTLIVRDMNRVSKFTMTDRRESSKNPDILCYIYNNKPTPILVDNNIEIIVDTGHITWNLIAINTDNPEIINNIVPKIEPVVPKVEPIVPKIEPVTPPKEEPVAPPAIEPIVPKVENLIPSNIELNFDWVSDLAKHFLTQRNIKAKLTQNTIKVWEKTTLTITIKDANTQAEFEWLLNLPLELIASNNNIETSYSLIQLIKDGKIEITITAMNKWTTTLLINFDWEKIGKINFSIE